MYRIMCCWGFVVWTLTFATTPLMADFPPVTDDLWDISQGTVVTNGSPTEFYSLTTNAFGGDSNHLLPGHVEHLHVIFEDFSNGGDLHFIEWQTSSPITLKSFVLNAAHDGDTRDIFWRGFSRFTLYGYNAGTAAFDIKLFELLPSNPFGTTPSPPMALVETNARQNLLSLAANVTPTTTDRFRAEFVQPGDSGISYLSPRIIELDGFDEFYPGVPEPSTATLTALGLLGVLGYARRKLPEPRAMVWS